MHPLIFDFYSPKLKVGEGGETFMFCALGEKFFGCPRISLTTLYLVYILLSDTKYRYFVV